MSLELLKQFITETVKRCNKKDRKKGKPWCLYTKDGSRVLGHHKAPKDAYAQEKAIEMNEETIIQLTEASYGSMREWFIDGKWIKISDNDDHGSFAKRYLASKMPYQDEDDYDDEDTDQYITKLINDYDAIRRHGNSFLIKNSSKHNIKIIQDKLIHNQADLQIKLWIGILQPPSNITCSVKDFIYADSIKDLDIERGLYR